MKIKKYLFLVVPFLSLLLIQSVDARTLMKVEKYFKKYFKDVTEIEQESFQIDAALFEAFEAKSGITWDPRHDQVFVFHKVYEESEITAYLCEHHVEGKHGEIRFMVHLSPSGKVEKVNVLASSEIRGRPITRKRYLRQYNDKTIQDPLRLGKDIQGISGATISSTGITYGVKKALYVYEHFYQGEAA